MNSVCIVGHLGRDPESRFTTAGKQVANLRIAVNEGFGDKKQTHWFDVVVWEHSAKFAQEYLTKGSKVAIQGRLRIRSWEDREGTKREQVEIVADRIDSFVPREQAVGKSEEIPDENIPF